MAVAGLLGLGAGLALRGYLLAEGAGGPAWLLVAGPGVLWAALAAAFGPRAQLLPAAGLALCLWAAAAIDLRTRRIPNTVVLATAAVGLLAQFAGVGLSGALPALAAAAAAGLLFSLLALLTRGGFGWGDAKLAAAIGTVLGPALTGVALAGTALAGGLIAAALLLARRVGLRDGLPYAPCFLLGGLLALALAARG